MSVWVILVALTTLIGLAWLYQHVHGVPQPLGSVEVSIIGLLEKGAHGALLVLGIPEIRDRIMFRKYVQDSDDYGVKLVVSARTIPAKRFEAVANFLRSRTKDCKEAQVDSEAGRPHEKLEVDFGADSGAAAQVLIDLLHQVYDISRNDIIYKRLR